MARARSRRRHQEQTPGWVWMLGGLSLGLVVAVGAYMAGMSSAVPPPDRARGPADTPAAPAVPDPASDSRTTAQPPASAPPPENPEEATRFEFYDLLPRYEVVVPEGSVENRDRSGRDPIELDGAYVLQVGSFRELADADRMQARVALLGIESQIQRVVIDDDVYHRVRVGPLTELAQVNRVRRRLRDERIEYMLINVPD